MDWVTKFDIKDVSYARLTFHFCIDYKGTIALLTDLTEEAIDIVTHNCRKNGAKRKEIV